MVPILVPFEDHHFVAYCVADRIVDDRVYFVEFDDDDGDDGDDDDVSLVPY